MFFFKENYKILRELKFRIIYCLMCFFFNFICFFLFSEEIIFSLTSCFLYDFGYFINTSILENLYVSLYVSLFFSFLIFLPFLLIHIWFFLVPGLYSYENKIYLFILFFYILIFLILFLNNFLISFIWKFLKNYNLIIHLKIFPIFLELSLINLIQLILDFIKLIVFIFIFPLFLILFFCYNLINLNFLSFYRKFLYILIYILICIFSVPDFFGQILSFFLIFIFMEIVFFLFLLIKYKSL